MSAFRICSQIVYSIIIDGAAAFQRFWLTKQLHDFGLIDIISMAYVSSVVMISYGLYIYLLKCFHHVTQLAPKLL